MSYWGFSIYPGRRFRWLFCFQSLDFRQNGQLSVLKLSLDIPQATGVIVLNLSGSRAAKHLTKIARARILPGVWGATLTILEGL